MDSAYNAKKVGNSMKNNPNVDQFVEILILEGMNNATIIKLNHINKYIDVNFVNILANLNVLIVNLECVMNAPQGGKLGILNVKPFVMII